jgi:spore coat polysaccharide biosynthesis protein SpsF
MTSSRLPGKHLLECDGQPFIEHLLFRLSSVPSVDQVVVATTQKPEDDELVIRVLDLGAFVFRGSEDDVLDRVLGAARSFEADLIVEITGDCPLIDPSIVEQSIRMFVENSAVYVGNAHVRSYPDGMDTQVFPLSALELSSAMTNEAEDREHVSLFMRKNPQIFPPLHLVAPPELHWPELGLTLDEERDAHLLRRVVEHFGPGNRTFSCREIVELLRSRPDWVGINASVERRSVL